MNDVKNTLGLFFPFGDSVSTQILGVFLYLGTCINRTDLFLEVAKWTHYCKILRDSEVELKQSALRCLDTIPNREETRLLFQKLGDSARLIIFPPLNEMAVFNSFLPHCGLAHGWTANWLCSGPDCSMNPEVRWAGEDAISISISLECRWQNVRIHELLGEPFVYHISLTRWLLSIWVDFWLDPRICLTVPTFKLGEMAHIWSQCLLFDQIYDLFKHLFFFLYAFKYDAFCIMVYMCSMYLYWAF